MAVRRLELSKRWSLRPGATIEEVVQLVTLRIVPAYRRLSGDVELGLEADTDGAFVVTTQSWSSVEAHEAAMRGPAFERWWQDYLPILEEWDASVEFIDEWQTVELDLGGD